MGIQWDSTLTIYRPQERIWLRTEESVPHSHWMWYTHESG